MNNLEFNNKLDDLCEHFHLIFDQYMNLYGQWTDKKVPQETIICMMTYFVLDLVYEENGKEATHQFFYNMIENYEDPDDTSEPEFNRFYN